MTQSPYNYYIKGKINLKNNNKNKNMPFLSNSIARVNHNSELA